MGSWLSLIIVAANRLMSSRLRMSLAMSHARLRASHGARSSGAPKPCVNSLLGSKSIICSPAATTLSMRGLIAVDLPEPTPPTTSTCRVQRSAG